MVYLTAILAVTGFLSLSTETARAQGGASWTMAWRGVPLERALQDLIEATDMDLAWDPLLVDGKQSFCVAETATAEEVLGCILDGTGLDFIRRSSGLYVLEIAARGTPLFGNLRGIILDAETEQPVSNAHIYLAEANRGNVANAEGMFIFPRLLPGEYTMRVSHMGYLQYERQISVAPGSDASTEVTLESTVISLTTPLIIDGIGMMPSSTVLGAPRTSGDDAVADIGSGTSGLLQNLDAMPGVRVNDATADVHIQGGEAGEHQFRLDGAPVFLPLNVASFIGPFSPFALGSITIHKAGFQANVGSQISGVIEAEHDVRIPPSDRGSDGGSMYTLQVDPLSTNARFTSFNVGTRGVHTTTMAALRVGTWSLVAPPSLSGLLDDWNSVDTFLLSAFAERNTPFANLPPEGEPAIQFLDVHQATRVRFGPLKTLNISGYLGRSSLGNDLSDRAVDPTNPIENPLDRLSSFTDLYSWQTAVAQARYDVVRGAHTLAHARVRGSFYNVNHDFEAPDEEISGTPEDDGNRVYELGAGVGVDYYSGGGHHLESGFELVLTGSRFRIAGTQQLPLSHQSSGGRLATYVQDRIQLGQHGVMEAGARWTWLHSRRTLYAEPRLSFRFDWNETPLGGMSLYLASGLYRQFVNQFDVSSRSPRTFVSSTRFWMGNDDSVSPPSAAHYAAEWLVRPDDDWEFSLESFYKRQYHILTIDYSADPAGAAALPSETGASPPTVHQSDFLQSSTGSTYGFGVHARRNVGAGNLGVRFERTVSRREITNLFRGERMTVPWSEPFRLELAVDIVPARGTVLLARWKSVWSRPWGYRKAYYDFLSSHLNDVNALLEEMRQNGVSNDAIRRVERQITHYNLTEPDAHVLDPVHQLDLSASWSTRIRNLGLQLRADVVNVLDRRNTAEWRFELDEDSYFGGEDGQTGLLERSERLLLPRVVTIAARVSW